MKVRHSAAFSLVFSMVLLFAALPAGTAHSQPHRPEPPCRDIALSGAPPLPRGNPHRTAGGPRGVPSGAVAPERATAPASPQDSGGPDAYGYTWDDTVPLSWIDATGGTDPGMTGYGWDQATGPVSLPFPFKFYENTYHSVYIAASGFLAFADEGYWPEQQNPLPSPEPPNNVIAPFWTVMYLQAIGERGRVYYKSGGTAPKRYFVAEWYDVQGGTTSDSSDGDETYRFEVVLHENGDIVVQYHTMTYDDWRYYASVGIEDPLGLDGLRYIDWDNYWSRLPTSGTAIRFYRPPPQARVSVRPPYQGDFASAGETVAFHVPIRNTGELGSDTYDLFVSSTWPAALYAADGTTPLIDTDFDGTVDTGSVAQGDTTTIVVKVAAPNMAAVGHHNTAVITARSSLSLSKSRTSTLQTAVPAPFAQAYRDDADGAASLYLVQPAIQVVKKTTPDWTWRSDLALAEMPDGFAYVWTDYRWTGSSGLRDIEYTLLDRYGRTTRAVSKLTSHSSATMTTYDYTPAVAVAPNGRIGVVWYRYLYDSGTGWNYNIYYAILDPAGDVIVPPTNLTNNALWGFG